MIPKSELRDGAYYVGAHRCTKVAVWNGKRNAFAYLNYSMGSYGCDYAAHPEDDDGHALFVPFTEIEVTLTDAECAEAGEYNRRKLTPVVELIGSAMADPRRLSLYELPNGDWKWLPDASVQLVARDANEKT